MKRINVIPLMVIMLLLVSCVNVQTQIPTATHTPTPVPPTHTPRLPATYTPTATHTSEPTFTPIPPTATEAGFLLPLPSGDPLSNWNGIPIMEGAISGEELDSEAYVFTIAASMDEIRKYYDTHLPALGFNPFAVGEGKPGTAMVMYMGDSGMLTMSILLVEEEPPLYYVMVLRG